MDPSKAPKSPNLGKAALSLISPPKTSIAAETTSFRSSRKDRVEGSGDSGESMGSNIDSKSPFRQGYPSPLIPLPLLVCGAAPNTEETINWPHSREIIHEILSKHLVNDFSVSVVNRLPPSLARQNIEPPSENQNLTCLIETKRDLSSDSWYLALKDFEEQFLLKNLGGFTIEILDPELFKLQYTQPIDADEPIVALWPQLRMGILNQLSGLEWSTLSVVRFGSSLQALDNPVTILISAPGDSDNGYWDSLIAKIQNIVDCFFLDEINIVINTAEHPFSALDDPTGKILPTSAFQSTIEMGSSFGPKDVEKAATMGGTIRLQHPDGSSYEALMSVFHCFRTIVGSDIESQGLQPSFNSSFHTVVPSALDRKNKLQWLDKEIHTLDEHIKTQRQNLEWNPDQRLQTAIERLSTTKAHYQAEKETIEMFNSNAGALWACSGFQIENLHDWSLSLASNRSISNTLPSPDHPGLSSATRYNYVPPSHSEIRSFSTKNVKSGSFVLKKGRTTGITVGIINSVRTDITLRNSQRQLLRFTGWEVIPSPADKPFVESGDSGSWALDMDGNWCGVVFAELSFGRGVMQDVNYIVADIKRITGCTIELP